MASTDPTISVPLRRRGEDERRQAERFSAAMPVRIDGREATTQDLSATGLSFVSDRPHVPGARVEVVIEYLLDGHHYPLRCEAEVVRVERTEGGFLVGARLTPHSQLPEITVGSGAAAAPAGGVVRHLRKVE